MNRTLALGLAIAVLAAALLIASPALAAEEEDPKAKDPNMEVLKLELPDPSFSGTPLDYWSEILELSFKPRPKHFVPKGTVLLSQGKPVTSSDVTVLPKKLKMVTDGDAKFEAESVLNLKPGPQYVQIDLQKKSKIEAVLIWHFHEYERVYFDVSVRVSNDPEFKDKEAVKVLFNNDHDNSSKLGVGKDKEYVEKNEGKLVDAKGVEARYVRLYTNGNCNDDVNTYVEAMVFGKVAE